MEDTARGVRPPDNHASAMGRFFVAWILACFALLATPVLVGVAPAAQRAQPRPAIRPAYADDHILVKLARGAGSAAAREQRGATPAALREERDVVSLFGDWYRVGVRPGETVDAAIARLRRAPGVRAVERDYHARILQNDPVYPQQWNFPMVQAQAAWAQGTGTGVTVAVLDTGMSMLANDFVASHILPYPSPYGTTNDLNGHGTHVSGTIAQATNNAIGAAGLAHGANVRPVKVMSDAGTGYFSDIAQGIYASALAGDEVINMSLGMPCSANWPACSTLIVNDAIKEAVDRDVVIVAASGNDNAPFVSFPANHPNVMAVGAVDIAQARAWYSNHGCALSLVAPGGTTSPNPSGGIYQQTYFNGAASVRPFQGTSMAAPHVAAAAAILRAKYPAATALQVRSAIQAAALDLGASGRDNLFGNGLLKINAALTALQAGPPPLTAADFCGNALLVPNPPVVTNAIDLRVASINVANATVDPQTFLMGGTAAVAIANWGNVAPASSYAITLFEDSNATGTVDPGEQLASFTCLSGNPACAIAPFGFSTFTIPVSGTLDFRDRRISAVVDPLAQIVESDETNNVSLSQGVCGTSTAVTTQPVLKWSRQLSAFEMATPIVADLNQDGLPEVIVREGTAIRAFSGQTGAPASFFAPPTLNASDPHLGLAVGNIDTDPFLEIIAMERYTGGPPNSHVIRAFEHDGMPKWSSQQILINLFHPISNWSPMIADLAHDGTPEVIAAGRILSAANGQVQAVLPTGPKLIGGAAVAVNLDQDPELEIVIGNLAFNPNGSAFWSNANPIGGYNAVADLNGDGAPDIIHTPHITPTTPVTSIRVYQGANGLPLAGWTIPSTTAQGLSGPPAVADVDGDGHPEVAVVGYNNLYVYRRDGSFHWSLPIAEHAGTPGLSAFDFNQDGRWELVLNDTANLLIVADIGGAPAIVGSSPASNQTAYEYPVVADIDGDGRAEIVAQTWDNNQMWLRAYQNAADNWPATRAIWNQIPYHAENVGANGQIPTTLPPSWWADNQFLVNPQPAPVGTGPELTAGQINATPSTLSAVVGNAGSSIANPVWVAFYDGPPNAGGTLIGATNLGPLAPGQFVTATVPHGLSGPHNIHVVADRNGGGAELFIECNEANNKHSRQLTFVPVDVRISKAVSPSAVAVGQSGTYTLTIASLSAANSQNTVVTDTLPPGIQVGPISYSPSSCSWNLTQSGQTLTFTRPAGIGAGMVCTITINFTATSAPAGGTVQNVATLTDDFDTVPVNNQASVTHQVVPAVPFDLRVVKYALGPAQRGYNLYYFIFVENVGSSPAAGPMQVVDTMTGGNSLIVFQSSGWQILINGGLRPLQAYPLAAPWTCNIVSSFWGFHENVVCNRNPTAPPILAGNVEVLMIQARVHALAGTQIIDTATLSAPNDSNPANNQFVKTDLVP